MNVAVTVGRISQHLKVTELTIRPIHDLEIWEQAIQSGAEKSELAGKLFQTADDKGFAYHLQGHLENISGKHLEDVRFDVSYYSKDATFLGLNRSKLLDDDDMEPGDQIPLDLKLQIPEDTDSCIFNARAKRKGWVGRLF